MSSRNADWLRAARAQVRAEGRCGECRTRPAADGCRTCRFCLDRHRERVAAYAAVSLCDCGAEPAPGIRSCQRCADAVSAREKARRLSRIAQGVCGTCGAAPCEAGRRNCLDCTEAIRLRRLTGSRLSGAAPKPCGTCGGTGHNSRTCERYHIMAKAWTA